MSELDYLDNYTFNESQLDRNDTMDDTMDDMYAFYAVPQLVFIAVVCVFIIVGNSCVLAAIRLSANGRKSRMNFFIMHLAIADLLVGVMVVVADMVAKLTVEWYAGNAMCKIIQYFQTTVTYSSTYMLVSLSLDRYDAVARPMNFSRSGLQGRCLVVISWAISLAFAAPSFYLFSETVREGKKQCWLEFPEAWQWQLFFTMVFLVTFLFPAIIIASCYIAIIYIIWSKGRYHEPKGTAHNQDVNVTQSRLINESRHDTGRGIIPQAKIRTIKMTLIIVIVFILCWSPYFLYNLLDVYELIPPSDSVATLIQSAAPLNSAANPIIYGIFSTRICKNLRRIPRPSFLRTCICQCQEPVCHRLGRHHQYLPSQATDPTLSTVDLNRVVDLKSHSSKRNSGGRLGKWKTCLSEVDRRPAALHMTTQKLRSAEQGKKGDATVRKGRQAACDHAVDGDYELAPLARNEVTGCRYTSEGSDESPHTSDSNVLKGKDYVTCDNENWASIDPVTQNDKFLLNKDGSQLHYNHTAPMKNKVPPEIKSLYDPDIRVGLATGQDITILLPAQDPCCSQREVLAQSSQGSRLLGDTPTISQNSNVVSVCADVCAESEAPYGDEGSNEALQEQRTDRACLSTRRPSGVPWVRRRLTSDDTVVLKNATCRWTSKGASADDSTVVA